MTTGRLDSLSGIADSLFRRQRFESGGEEWLAVRRAIADLPIDLVVAGPRGRYVTPFQRAARMGVLAVTAVSLFAILLTGYLTCRVTALLEALADAAAAVATGELDRRVEANGTIEVQRVATAFNSMTASLRRTLGALSQRQALAAVGEYAASLSHEVRNALTAIRVDLQRANEKLVENADSRALHRARAVVGHATRLRGDQSRSGSPVAARHRVTPLMFVTSLTLPPAVRRAHSSSETRAFSQRR